VPDRNNEANLDSPESPPDTIGEEKRMPEYPPGTPSWVDLSSPDPDASAAFYKELFGWEAVESEDPEAGGYRQFKLNGKSVAGLSPIWQEQQPPMWTTYVSVADADEAAGKIKDAGGQLFMEPFEVLDAGRMAVFADTTAAVCAIWQPKAHRGAEIVNRVGALGWNELQTRDLEKAKEFYSAVFGWRPETMDFDGGEYTRWFLGERIVGGMIEIGEDWPPEMPSNWAAYFNVDDADETVAKAQATGGKLLEGPRDIPDLGRFAFLADRHGAAFAVIALVPEARERNEAIAAEIGA
jgi:hypothetical protein